MRGIKEDDGFELRYSKNSAKRALTDLISSSKKRNELVCGVYEAAQVLRRGKSDSILFCILVKSADPANQVFCRLIEAYCWENRIKVIKVDCPITLTLMTGGTAEEIHHCVLIKKPEETVEESSLAHQMLLTCMQQRQTWFTISIS